METLNALISSNCLKNGQNHQMERDIPEPDIFVFFSSFVLLKVTCSPRMD